MTGTSTSTPTTVESAAPDWKPKRAIAVATASSKKLLAPINAEGPATLYSTLSVLKAFFKWLADKPGYKSRISHADAEYFNLSEKETRVATAHRETQVPTREQIRRVLNSMPAQSDIEKRIRAAIAFVILTGARDGATASFKLKHIDIAAEKIEQDAREVKTKRSKTFTTCFFPVADDICDIVVG
jgi:integrase/recombinase XerD